MIEVRTVEQLSNAIHKLRADYARGLGTIELIRSLGIDPLTDLRGADWRGTNFAGCDLKGVDFSHCRLSNCDFTRADVAGAIFYGADLYKSTIHRALNLPSAYMSDEQSQYLEVCRKYDAGNENDEQRVFQINRSIYGAPNFQSAVAHFNSILSRGFQPDQYSASMLISRAKNVREAWEAFRKAEAAKCPLDNVVFIELASKMQNVTQVREVIEMMQSRGLLPGNHIYNTLLARTKTHSDSHTVLSEMKDAEIKADNVTFTILMRREDFHGRKALFQQLVNAGLHPTATELNILMQGANSEDEADEVMEIANQFDISRNSKTYALLAPHKLRTSAFEGLIEDMAEDDLCRDIDFYKMAFARTRTFGDACFLYGHMRIDEISPNAHVYDRLAKLAEISRADFDPGRITWPAKAIESLIRRVGASVDIVAAGLTDETRD